MSDFRYVLEPYNGVNTRFICQIVSRKNGVCHQAQIHIYLKIQLYFLSATLQLQYMSRVVESLAQEQFKLN